MPGRQTAAAPADVMAKTAPDSWEYEDARPAPIVNDNAIASSSLSPRELARILRSNVRRILTLAAALFALGLVVLLMFPAKYSATSLVLVDPREQRVTNEQDVLPGIGQDAAALQSIIEIAKSDGFLRPLIEKLGVANDTEVSGGETNIARLLTRFRSRLDVSRRGLTYVIAISFSHSDANRAAFYANAIAEAFVAEQARTRLAATEQAASWLNDRLKALRDQLTKSEDAIAAFKAQYRIVEAGRDSTIRQVRATELTQQASIAKVRAEEAKTRYDQAVRDLRSNVDNSTGLRSELLSALRAQRTTLNDQIAQKRAVFGERHPDLAISFNQREELERQIEAERRRIVQAAKSDYDAAREQQKHFEDLLNNAEKEMLTTAQATVKLQDLQREADANRSIYEQFLARYKTTNEQRSLQTSQTKIVSLATVPARPSRPALPILLAAIAMASMLLALSAVTVYEFAGRSWFARKPMRPEAEPELPQTPQADAVPTAASPAAAAQATSPILDLPVWAVVPLSAGNGAAARQIEGGLADLLEKIALSRGLRGRVVLVLSGSAQRGRPAIAEALNSLATDRGMLSFLVQLQPEQAHSVVNFPHPFFQTSASTVRATTQSLLQLLSGRPTDGQPAGSDIRADFDIIVVDGTALQDASDIANLAPYVDYAVFLVGDAHEPVVMTHAMNALARNRDVAKGVVIDQAAA
jgi:uncharacterized protein involved in exopolysaccharide biosynthesis